MVAAVWDMRTAAEQRNSTLGPLVAGAMGAALLVMGLLAGSLAPALAMAGVLTFGSALAHRHQQPLTVAQAVAIGVVHMVALLPFL